jgi:hypothetical protein
MPICVSQFKIQTSPPIQIRRPVKKPLPRANVSLTTVPRLRTHLQDPMLTWEFPRSCPVRDSHAGGPVLAKELVSPGKLSPYWTCLTLMNPIQPPKARKQISASDTATPFMNGRSFDRGWGRGSRSGRGIYRRQSWTCRNPCIVSW